MSKHQPHWDLSTIPDDVWNSEQGRRVVSKRWQNIHPEIRAKRKEQLQIQKELRAAEREYKRLFKR